MCVCVCVCVNATDVYISPSSVLEAALKAHIILVASESPLGDGCVT
jgi:hypothetical protein